MNVWVGGGGGSFFSMHLTTSLHKHGPQIVSVVKVAWGDVTVKLTCSVDVLMVTGGGGGGGGGGGVDTVRVWYWKCSGYVLALYQCCIVVAMY